MKFTFSSAIKHSLLCSIFPITTIGLGFESKAMSQEIHASQNLPVYELFLKETENRPEPMVSIRAPEMRAKATGKGFQLVLNSQNLATRLQMMQPDVTQLQDYYREARNFYDAQVVLSLKTWGPGGAKFPQLEKEIELRKVTFPLTQDNQIVSFDNVVSSFTATIIGKRNLFKCFSSETCVEDGSVERQVHFDWSLTRSETSLIQTHEPILEAEQGEIVIEKRLQEESSIGNFRVKLRDGEALRHLGLESFLNRLTETNDIKNYAEFNGAGSAAHSIDNFVGLAAPLAYHGSVEAPESRTPRWIAHIFPQGNALKVRVERLPYYTCGYIAGHGDNNQMSLTMPPGTSCPRVPFYSFIQASGGQDDTDVREWLFHDSL